MEETKWRNAHPAEWAAVFGAAVSRITDGVPQEDLTYVADAMDEADAAVKGMVEVEVHQAEQRRAETSGHPWGRPGAADLHLRVAVLKSEIEAERDAILEQLKGQPVGVPLAGAAVKLDEFAKRLAKLLDA